MTMREYASTQIMLQSQATEAVRLAQSKVRWSAKGLMPTRLPLVAKVLRGLRLVQA